MELGSSKLIGHTFTHFPMWSPALDKTPRGGQRCISFQVAEPRLLNGCNPQDSRFVCQPFQFHPISISPNLYVINDLFGNPVEIREKPRKPYFMMS